MATELRKVGATVVEVAAPPSALTNTVCLPDLLPSGATTTGCTATYCHGNFRFNGVDAERGVTNLNFAEAEVKRAMIQAAREVIVVADGSKIGAVEAARVCSIAEVDVVVTDASAGSDEVIQLEQAGTTVHCA